jgi:hypothetical protein
MKREFDVALENWIIVRAASGEKYIGEKSDVFSASSSAESIYLNPAYSYVCQVGIGQTIQVRRMVIPIDGNPHIDRIEVLAESVILVGELPEAERKEIVRMLDNAETMREEGKAASAGVITAPSKVRLV